MSSKIYRLPACRGMQTFAQGSLRASTFPRHQKEAGEKECHLGFCFPSHTHTVSTGKLFWKPFIPRTLTLWNFQHLTTCAIYGH